MPLPLPVGLGDREPLEEVLPSVEDLLQRGDHQRLAETPRTGKEIHFAPVIQKIPDQAGLIHIVKSFRSDLLKILYADR